MNPDEIRSLPAALRYLRQGDDPAARRRLASLLAAMALNWIVVVAVVAVLIALAVTR